MREDNVVSQEVRFRKCSRAAFTLGPCQRHRPQGRRWATDGVSLNCIMRSLVSLQVRSRPEFLLASVPGAPEIPRFLRQMRSEVGVQMRCANVRLLAIQALMRPLYRNR